MPITKAQLVAFSLRRPDVQTATLYSRTSNSNTYGAGVEWRTYRAHIDTTQERVAVSGVEWRFIHQDQAVIPKLGDKFTAGGVTWQISQEVDLNVLGAIINVTAEKHQ